MSRDLHHNVRVIRCISPIAVGTTGTGQTGKIIDRAGFESVEFIVNYGSVTATNAVFTVTAKEGDVTGTMTSIADADLLGNETFAGLGQAATRTSGTSKNVSKRFGYKGIKRYVQLSVKSTVTAAAVIGADVLLGNPRNAPVAT